MLRCYGRRVGQPGRTLDEIARGGERALGRIIAAVNPSLAINGRRPLGPVEPGTGPPSCPGPKIKINYEGPATIPGQPPPTVNDQGYRAGLTD